MADIDIRIDKEKCIGCGLCEEDCSRGAITILQSGDGRTGSDEGAAGFTGTCAEVNTAFCNECGHCVAVCPQAAVTLYGQCDADWPDERKGEGAEQVRGSAPDAEAFLNFLKFRRSIRHYTKQKIETEKLSTVVEAGRYSPTAGNRQQNRFIILQDNIEEVRAAAVKALYDAAADEHRDLGRSEVYRRTWTRMYDDYVSGRTDRLFFGAPAVVLITSDEENRYAEIDGGIAASRMELQANALGLGVCYIGFLNTAMELDGRIKELAGLNEGEKLSVAFVMGYPDVRYQRPAPRKAANVEYL